MTGHDLYKRSSWTFRDKVVHRFSTGKEIANMRIGSGRSSLLLK